MMQQRKNVVYSIYKYGHWSYKHVKVPIIRETFIFTYKILFFLVSKMLFNAEISPLAKIGKNLRLPHHGQGVIVAEAIIGDNVVIRPQVIIGKTLKSNSSCPIIGNNVDIGVGAKIIGNIKIGDNVKVGANAVVIKDVPSNATVVGIPGKVLN